MISSQNGTSKIVRQDWLLRQNRKTKAVPIQSRIVFVNRQTKVFKIFWVLRFLEKYSMKMTILQSIVILQTPLAANDTNQEFLAEIQVRLKKKWNCQTQGHLIPSTWGKSYANTESFIGPACKGLSGLHEESAKEEGKKNDKIEKIFFV